jgi:AcrR family transcriptional regulator
MPTRDTADTDARTRLLDAAEELFYARGVQSAGMDKIRTRSGLPLKRIYQLYPGGKNQLVVAFLDRRDRAWRDRLAGYARQAQRPPDRILAVFDWLGQWCAEPGFRGCAWINAQAELGAVLPGVARAVRAHKDAFRRYLADLVADAGYPDDMADAVYLLAEGAMVAAGIDPRTNAAAKARQTVALLLNARAEPAETLTPSSETPRRRALR